MKQNLIYLTLLLEHYNFAVKSFWMQNKPYEAIAIANQTTTLQRNI